MLKIDRQKQLFTGLETPAEGEKTLGQVVHLVGGDGGEHGGFKSYNLGGYRVGPPAPTQQPGRLLPAHGRQVRAKAAVTGPRRVRHTLGV